MPKHKPIRFEKTFEPTLMRGLKQVMEKPKAKTIKNVALALAALGGMLTLGVMAPNVTGIFGRAKKARRKASYEEYRALWTRFHALKKRGVFDFVEEKDNILVYRLTPKGKELVKKLIWDEIEVPIPDHWDGNWHLLIFDIPEKIAYLRFALREKIKEMGFYQCQKSVWIHPFPCLEEIEFLKQNFDLAQYIKLFTISEMTDGKVLYHFKELLKQIIAKENA